MFFKLALNNIKKSYKDYLIYFLTISFGICLFYLFNSIESQKSMMILDTVKLDILEMLTSALDYVSFFMTIVLAFLMIYANQFLIKRRKKEIGIYMILGMRKEKISTILVIETALIGVVSLIVGLLLGVLGSHLLSIVTARMFQVDMKAFRFIFSLEAFKKAIVNFSFIYLLMMLLNTINISRVKLIDLFTAGRKQEDLKIKSTGLSILVFILSLIILGVSYGFIVKNGMMSFDIYFKGSIILGIIGTILFFMSLSGILMHLFKANKKIYLNNLNMFSLRQIHSKVNSTYIMMAILSILLLIAIGTFSTGMGIVSVVDENQEALLPAQLSLNYWIQDDGISLEESIPDINKLGDYQKIIFYRDQYSFSDILEKKLDKGSLKEYGIENHAIEFMKLSDFNKFLEKMHKQTYELEQEYIVLSNHYEIYEILNKYSKDIQLNNQTLKNKMVLELSVENSIASNISALLVVEDSLLEHMKPAYEVYNFYKTNQSTEDIVKTIEELRRDSLYFNYTLKDKTIAESLGLKTIISYISIYVGFVFIMSVVVCLALQQLGEASDNVHRYELLRKLGVEDKMIKHSLLTQIGVYFFMPLGLAIIHSVVGIKVASGVVQVIGNLDILQNMVLTSGFLILIYGSYFIVTYVASVAIVIKQR